MINRVSPRLDVAKAPHGLRAHLVSRRPAARGVELLVGGPALVEGEQAAEVVNEREDHCTVSGLLPQRASRPEKRDAALLLVDGCRVGSASLQNRSPPALLHQIVRQGGHQAYALGDVQGLARAAGAQVEVVAQQDIELVELRPREAGSPPRAKAPLLQVVASGPSRAPQRTATVRASEPRASPRPRRRGLVQRVAQGRSIAAIDQTRSAEPSSPRRAAPAPKPPSARRAPQG